ncbi:nucleoside/nucleotide kinase family protein [Kineosporia succinea]|uniref:Uridine kinase n=1 Tax=Kineosporia succinea TaxID=84632 RepID=A0ABT9PEQ2_9ACTN|nr:hypothetical protein [Kineosporia succinea]MDP9831188.1 hypothetical protein [Kineosporia succinea]
MTLIFPDGPWRVAPLDEVAARLPATATRHPETADRPPASSALTVVAVDGHGGSGKSTLATALATRVPRTAIVHTDDIAWHHSIFGWSDLLVDGVLAPARRGEEVTFRPPAWQRRGREGAVHVPAGTRTLVVEGTGAGRLELAPFTDLVIFLDADLDEGRRRCLARDGDTPQARAFWDGWMAEETPFMAEHRPWERAGLILCGTSDLPHDPTREAVVRD